MELSNVSYNYFIYSFLQSYNKSELYKNEPNIELESALVWDSEYEEHTPDNFPIDGSVEQEKPTPKDKKFPITVSFYNIITNRASLKRNREDNIIQIIGNAKANHRMNVSNDTASFFYAHKLEVQVLRFLTWLNSIQEIVADDNFSMHSYQSGNANVILLIETFFQYRYSIAVSYINDSPKIKRVIINNREIYSFT